MRKKEEEEEEEEEEKRRGILAPSFLQTSRVHPPVRLVYNRVDRFACSFLLSHFHKRGPLDVCACV